MSRFVRQSAYRHVFGKEWKENYGNIKTSNLAFDTDLVKCSPKYLSVNWQASGGGAFCIIPLDRTGKLPDLFPLVRAHTAPVLDTAWSPFDDALVASSGEDGKVAITRVDDTVFDMAYASEGHSIRDLEPISGPNKMGHGRKAGQVLFHPTANNVLGSASYEVKLWDVDTMQCRSEFDRQPDIVQSMDFDWTGSNMATTCKDKKLRLFDTRKGGAPHTMADSHSGVKGSRVCWMGDLDRICTTGFSKMSDRQIFIWDTRNMSAPSKTVTVDTSSGTLMPFFSVGNNILFFAGKGDGNVRYYEYEGDELYPLSEYRSSEPQRGMTFMAPRALNTHECEIARAYKITTHAIEPISFIVPRKSEAFQADIYPPAPSGEPALSAEEFFSGKTAGPLLVNMDDQSKAPVQPVRKSTAPPSAAPSPTHSRAPTSTTTAEPPKPASTPIHPASSISEVGGNSSSLPSLQTSIPATPVSAPSSTPQTPITKGSSSSLSTSATTAGNENGNIRSMSSSTEQGKDNQEAETLKKENERLKNELSERDHLIRKLELQVESLKANAKIAREALSKF